LEITDDIQGLIDSGYEVHPYLLNRYWIDTGNMQDVLLANRQVLATTSHFVESSAEIDEASFNQTHATSQTGARIRTSGIRGPAIIGQRAHRSGSKIMARRWRTWQKARPLLCWWQEALDS
jgi:glucose-1-phosphate thymidylyltransferase